MPSFSLQFGQERKIYLALFWKKGLLICFESYHGIPYSQRQTRKSMVKIFHIANTTQYIRDSLRINFAVYSFLSSSVRNQRKPGLYFQQAKNILGLNLQLFCQKIDKNYRLVNCSICFFKGVDVLGDVLMFFQRCRCPSWSWCPCTNLMIWSFKKTWSQKCCFKGYLDIANRNPVSSCFVCIMDKTHHGSVIAPFLCNFCSFFDTPKVS